MLFSLLFSVAFAAQSFRGMTSNADSVTSAFEISGDNILLAVTSSIDTTAPQDDEYKVGYGDATTVSAGKLMQEDEYTDPTTSGTFTAKVTFDVADVIAAEKHSHVVGANHTAPDTDAVHVESQIAYTAAPTVVIAADTTDATKAKATFTFTNELGAGPYSLRKKGAAKIVLTKVVAESNVEGSYYGSIDKAQLFTTDPVALGFVADETPATPSVTDMITHNLAVAPAVGVTLGKTGKVNVGGALTADDQLIFVKKDDKSVNTTFTAATDALTPEFPVDGSGAAVDLLVAKGKGGVPSTVLTAFELTAGPAVTYAFAKTAEANALPKIVATATTGVADGDTVYLQAATTTEKTKTAAAGEDTKITFEGPLTDFVREIDTDNLYLFKKSGSSITTSPVIVPAAAVTFENGAATDTDMVYNFKITAGSLKHAPGTVYVYPDGTTPDLTKAKLFQLTWTDTLGSATASYKYADLDSTLTYKAVVIPATIVLPTNMPTEIVAGPKDAPKEKPVTPEPEASFSVVASFFLALTSIAVLLF